jgi:ribosomal protein L22
MGNSKKIKAGDNPMPYKKKMAYEITKTIKGQKLADKAQKFLKKQYKTKK